MQSGSYICVCVNIYVIYTYIHIIYTWIYACTLDKILSSNDWFRVVLVILVMRHISTGIFTRIARGILVKIPVEMCQFTRIPMTHINVSFEERIFLGEVFARFLGLYLMASYLSGKMYIGRPPLRRARASRHNGAPLRVSLRPLGTILVPWCSRAFSHAKIPRINSYNSVLC